MAQESKPCEQNQLNVLEQSTNISFSSIINEIRNLDISASFTVGLFHNESQIPNNEFLTQFTSNIDIENNKTSRDALYKYTILDSNKIKASIKATWVNESTSYMQDIDSAVGSFVGMTIGDAIGHPLEFVSITKIKESSEHRPRFDYKQQKYFNEYNKFQLSPGQWTDDASMGLCIADSLIINGKYNGSDIRTRFWNWWQNGYNNAFKFDEEREKHSSVGLGGNISSSIFDCEHGKIPTERYEVDHDDEDSGNGSLMRLAPIAIFYHTDIEKGRQYAFESSFLTHPGYISAECCSLLAFIIVYAIHPKQNGINFDVAKNVKQFMNIATKQYGEILKQEISVLKKKCDVINVSVKEQKQDNVMDNDDNKLLKRECDAKELILRLINSSEIDNKEICWNWKNEYGKLPIIDCYHIRCGGEEIPHWARDEYNGYPVSPEYWGSYCMDGLAIAMHCVYNSLCFGDAIQKCVNLLGDADTTAAIAGQICGAIYGYKSIVNNKQQKFMVDQLIKWDEYGFAFRSVLLYILGDESIQKLFS